MKIPEHNALMVDVDTDLFAVANDSLQIIYYPCASQRKSAEDDLAQLHRILQPNGTLILQTTLAPTKKHRPIYLSALESVLQGKRIRLYNEYEWLRWIKHNNFNIIKQERLESLVAIEMLDVPRERIEKARILLHQCPSDLLEFVEPIFPPNDMLGYISRRLEMVLQKPASRQNTV